MTEGWDSVIDWKSSAKTAIFDLEINHSMTVKTVIQIHKSVLISSTSTHSFLLKILDPPDACKYSRRQKKVPPFDPYNGRPFKKNGRRTGIERAMNGTARSVQIPV